MFACLSLAAGLSFFARHVAGMAVTGGRYNPLVYNAASIRVIPPAKYDFKPDDVVWDEAREYGRFAQEVLRGEWLGATGQSFGAFLAQGALEGEGWYRDRLGPILLAAVAAVTDVPTAFLLADLVLPTLGAFFVLILCWQLRAEVRFCVFAASLCLWANWQDLAGLLAFLRGAPQNASIWLRTPYPQLALALLAIFFAGLIHFHFRPTARLGALLGAGLLALFYTYFYAWSFAFVLTGVYLGGLIVPLVAKGFLQTEEPRARLTRLAPFVAAAVAAAFPVWGALVANNPAFQDSFVRVFGRYSHAPDLTRSALLLAPLVVTLVLGGTKWKTRWFWLLFWVTCLVVLNQQVITGKVNQPDHWTGSLIEPLAMLFVCDAGLVLYGWIKPRLRYEPARAWVTAIVAAVFVLGLTQNVYKFWQGAEGATAYQEMDESLAGLMRAMEAREREGEGFLTNDAYLAAVLPAYLRQKPLNPWYMDPLTNEQIASVRAGAQAQFGHLLAPGDEDATNDTQGGVRYDPTRVLLILNRHRGAATAEAECEVVYENTDLLVVRAARCARE
jgi:hypothetical protein